MCVDNKQQLLIYCWLNSAILITYCDLICKGVLLCCPTVKLRFQYEGFIYFSRFQACLKSLKIPLEST